MGIFGVLLRFLRSFLHDRAALAAENLDSRQHLSVLKRSVKRPKFRRRDRIFWVWLTRLWKS